MCLPEGEFLVGQGDVLPGEIDGCPFSLVTVLATYNGAAALDERLVIVMAGLRGQLLN